MALVGTKAEAWIRVAYNDVALIKLALDTGAKEVVVPMVTTKAEVEQAVSASKYPPKGIRGWGSVPTTVPMANEHARLREARQH